MFRYSFLFCNMIIIDKTYNYSAFNNIKLAKLNSNRLIMAKTNNKQRNKKPRKDIIKSNDLNKSNKSECFLACFVYK